MSVPEGQRGESKFEVFVKAKDLCCYTIKICCNPKVFLPEYQNALTNDIIHSSKEIFAKCWMANNIMVKGDKARAEERLDLQRQAILECNNLLAMMQIAQQLFHLKTKRIKYWGEMTIEVRNLIRKWHDSDRKRYTDL